MVNLKKERSRVNDFKPVPVKEDKFFFLKRITEKIRESFGTKTMILFSILYIVMSIIISFLITFNTQQHFIFAMNIINFITPYYAITIGFSITTIVFILSDLERFSRHNQNTMERIVSLIISYIALGLITIIIFLMEIIFGNLFLLDDIIRQILNVIFFTVIIFLNSINFHLFFKIISVLYYLSHSLIGGRK